MRGLLAACALLGGCALVQPPLKTTTTAPAPAPIPWNALAIGKSTKADVRAALGDAVVVDFASGYEVWVYRGKFSPPGAELVLLFEPSGILTKTRVR